MSDIIDEALDPVRWALDDAETLLRHAMRELRMAELDVEGEVTFEGIGENTEDTPADWRVRRQLETLEVSFADNIVEPKGNNWQLIDRRIRTAAGLGWTWEDEYTRNGQFAWCGAEAALGLRAAGLLPEIARQVMPSCYRLGKFCITEDAARRRVVPSIHEAQPGDLVIVGPASGRWWGAHITTFLELDAAGGRVRLHEGNAKATGPLGDYREGVGRRWRPLERKRASDYVPMHIYRFLDTDFEPVK